MVEEYVLAAVVAEERDYGGGEGEKIYLKRLRDESNPFDRSEGKFRKLFRLSRAMGRHVVDTLLMRYERGRTFKVSFLPMADSRNEYLKLCFHLLSHHISK